MKPERVQRSRTKGSKLPDNTVCVTRGPGMKWGNPFLVMKPSFACPGGLTAREAVDLYRSWLHRKLTAQPDLLEELRGKNLACWCPLPEPGQPDICHAAVLLELANGPGRNPVRVRCTLCGHVWTAAYVPMEFGKFAKLLGKVACPKCAAGPKLIVMASNREPADG